MIVGTGTLSRAAAAMELMSPTSRTGGITHDIRWIGFDEGEDYPARYSPLRTAPPSVVGIVVEMHDFDPDERNSKWEGPPPDPYPTPRLAANVVSYVLSWHRRREKVALIVHCMAGRYRSGAVVEWVTTDLGVPEYPWSNRRFDDFGNRLEHGTANKTFLRMLRQAHDRLR